jgi:nickel/cobalt transporter (NicO) family protein
MDNTLWILFGTAAFIGFFHTVIGPDHYLPFIMLSRANQWSTRKTFWITFLCGIGHILSSVLLGMVGILIGVALRKLELIESVRGSMASYLLIGFGLAYALWGIRQGIRNKPHNHPHIHINGNEHLHEHNHHTAHAHVHTTGNPTTLWTLFIIFVLGPCEPLIPLLMFPAAVYGWVGVVSVAAVFGIVTIGTMTTIVLLVHRGLKLFTAPWIERYAHALAGGAIAMSGIAIKIFGL